MHNDLKRKEFNDELHAFLFEELNSELNDAEEYKEQYSCAKELGNLQLATMLLNHSRDELKHASEILQEIKREVPTLEEEKLYPLFKSTVSWFKGLSEEINSLK